MDSETIEATAAQWFAKQKSDRWTGADQICLDAWLDAATAHRVAFIRLEAAWQHFARLKALGAGVPAGVIPGRNSWSFSPLFARKAPGSGGAGPSGETRTAVSRGGLSRSGYRVLAAALFLAVVAGAGWYLALDDSNSFQTQIGATNTIPLPDGSRITLNTDSRIRVTLGKTERRIELERGEAFFVVARDAQRPFTVVAGEKRIVAVGTQFSVRREADEVRIVVTEGRVRLEEGAGGAIPPTQLDAGAVAQTKSAAMHIRTRPLPEVEQILSWRTGYVTFRDTELAQAVTEFNRYSPRKITIQDAEIAHIRIGGNFRTDNADAFLWLLQNGFRINVERREDRIVLTAR